MRLQAASLKMTERLMIKTHLFSNGCSLKSMQNITYLLTHPRRVTLEIVYDVNNHSHPSMPYLKTLLIPVAFCALR